VIRFLGIPTTPPWNLPINLVIKREDLSEEEKW
jgi:hypothetical protein